jgi:hypothetical protein
MDGDRGAVCLAMSIALSTGSIGFGDILRNLAATAQGKIRVFSAGSRTSIEGRGKLALPEEDRRLVVIVAHLGIPRR